MPRPQKHPHALFSLCPENQLAEQVIQEPRNRHLLETLQTEQGETKLALNVGFDIRSKSRSARTLAILGRGDDADIILHGSKISKIQCSFEINLDTKVVMLFHRSFSGSTQVYSTDRPGAMATPFEFPRFRQVVVMDNINEIIEMGGSGPDCVRFRINWHQNQSETMAMIMNERSLPQN
ncbi:MAG: hypothetical protein Q9182_001752 [Xanthomendoza sp. 2 TL-2023]